MRDWAEPERVVQVLYGVVQEGGEVARRSPKGAWEREGRELEGLREMAGSTSGEEQGRRQLESVEFLRV